MTLDDLTTDELRERALAKAEKAHDLGFVWELVKHLRGSAGQRGSRAQ